MITVLEILYSYCFYDITIQFQVSLLFISPPCWLLFLSSFNVQWFFSFHFWWLLISLLTLTSVMFPMLSLSFKTLCSQSITLVQTSLLCYSSFNCLFSISVCQTLFRQNFLPPWRLNSRDKVDLDIMSKWYHMIV